MTKDEAVALVDLAAGAVSAWRRLADTYHAELFRTLLLAGPRLGRSR